MRHLGPALAASLFAALVANAQPPQPPAQPPAPQLAAGLRLDAHLDGWEKAMGRLENFGAAFELVRKDAVFNRNRQYEGDLWLMKPGLARLEIKSKTDKDDHEKFVCDGRSVFHYDAGRKAVTEFKVNPGGGADGGMFGFLGGMKAADAKTRFQIGLEDEGPDFVILDIRPRLGKDQQEFSQLRLALLAPTNKAQLPAYLPYVVWKRLPNGDTEDWKLRRHTTNAPGVNAKMFQYEPVPGWSLQRASAPPPPPPQ